MNLICANCGINFDFHRKKQYCSAKCCREKHRRSLGISKFKPREDKICKGCGKSFYRNTSGVYCNAECRIAYKKSQHQLKQEALAKRKAEIAEQRSIDRLNQKLISIVKAYAKFKAIHHKNCKHCGKEYVARNFGTPSLYCSIECRKESSDELKKKYRFTECYQKAKRIGKAKRRANLRKQYDPIDPIDIFARDKWKCQLCFKDTPMILRGSYDYSAPELDHIIPLSRGGLHIIDNVRCLCRSCNALKGNKLDNEINHLGGTKTVKIRQRTSASRG